MELKYSPDGKLLVAGGRDGDISLHSVAKGYKRVARCRGHSSYIRHVDWSVDGTVLQSCCGAYELLYWNAATGKQVLGWLFSS